MKNFNKIIEEQIIMVKTAKRKNEETETMNSTNKQTSSNFINFNKKMKELYYKFFIDTTLVKIIENQIKNVTCEDDKHKTFKIEINYYLYMVNSQIHDYWLNKNKEYYFIRGISVSEPNIGETLNISAEDVSNTDMDMICSILPAWIMQKNILNFDNWSLNEKNTDDLKYITLSFTCSLQKLIDLYYNEKLKEEKTIKLNNYSKKKKKK